MTYVKAVPELQLLLLSRLRKQSLSGSASARSSFSPKTRPFRGEPVNSKNSTHEKVRECGYDERAPDKVQENKNER